MPRVSGPFRPYKRPDTKKYFIVINPSSSLNLQSIGQRKLCKISSRIVPRKPPQVIEERVVVTYHRL